jgi:HD-GYP domain-containing protein (c-di-GMP phosphodiesterase class II)
MSSDRPSGGPSPRPDPPPDTGELAELIRNRGAPLIEALESHLPGAGEHADATGAYAFGAAAELGFARRRCEAVREAARLHEIGKVYTLESHHEAGSRLARGAGIPEAACAWILHARERFDGRGPGGLVAIQIPLESRVIRAACACDLFRSQPSRDEGAIEDLRGQAGRELDPRVVHALIAILARAQTAP